MNKKIKMLVLFVGLLATAKMEAMNRDELSPISRLVQQTISQTSGQASEIISQHRKEKEKETKKNHKNNNKDVIKLVNYGTDDSDLSLSEDEGQKELTIHSDAAKLTTEYKKKYFNVIKYKSLCQDELKQLTGNSAVDKEKRSKLKNQISELTEMINQAQIEHPKLLKMKDEPKNK